MFKNAGYRAAYLISEGACVASICLCALACATRSNTAGKALAVSSTSSAVPTLSLTLAHGGTLIQEASDPNHYSVTLPVGQHRLGLIATASQGAKLTLDGQVLRSGAPWISAELSEGIHDFRLQAGQGAFTRSAVVTVRTEQRSTRLVLKGEQLGFSQAAISADGRSIAVVGSPSEILVNPSSTAEPTSLFRFERVQGQWRLQERIPGPEPRDPCGFGIGLALSPDGGTMGVWSRCDDEDNVPQGGQVRLWRVRDNTSAFMGALDRPPRPNGEPVAVAISGDGSTIAIGAPGATATACTGQPPTPDANIPPGLDEDPPQFGAVYVHRSGTDGWKRAACLQLKTPQARDAFGDTIGLSFDGSVLAVGARGESSGIDDEGFPVPGTGAVFLFERGEDETWTQSARLEASNANSGDSFGNTLALSADGRTLAVGAPGEGSAATGVNGNQSDESLMFAGAVYVFESGKDGTWKQRAYVKRASAADEGTIPSGLALSGDGQTMAIGISSAYRKPRIPGAVQMMHRLAGQWSYGARFMAPYPKLEDRFGQELALSNEATTLTIRVWNDGDANPADDPRFGPNATYIFESGVAPAPAQ